MKAIISILLTCAGISAYASDKATYVVPVPPELAEYSHFDVEIVASYSGEKTDEVAYVFPEELTGSPALMVQLKRVSGTNKWEGPEMNAHCTDTYGQFVCNIYLNKTKTASLKDKLRGQLKTASIGQIFIAQLEKPTAGISVVDKNKVADFLKGNTGSQDVLQKKLDVLDKFLSSEPAGVLTYKYKK